METSIQNNPHYRRQRRRAVSEHPDLIGLENIEVEWHQRQGNLRVYFVPATPSQADKQSIPANLTRANFEISTMTGEVAPLEIRSLSYFSNAPYVQLEIALLGKDSREHDRRLYCLKLHNVESADRHLSQVYFTLEKILHLNPQEPRDFPPPLQLPREINYLAKDYQSFRLLILDYLNLLLPNWRERNEADLGIVLVDVLAYVADYLSYYQDAVATESYLGTARRRISLARHARLLDYRVCEGCNARVWVQVQVQGELILPIGTPMLTQSDNTPGRILVDEYEQLISEANLPGIVFETMEQIHLYAQHNQIYFYTYGLSPYSLKKGDTQATLKGHFPHLQQGDVLIFEEVIGTEAGAREQAITQYRHAVRLSQQPKLSIDRAYDQAITEIEWTIEDELPFNLPIVEQMANGRYKSNCTVARGNIVLADSGRTIKEESLPAVPEQEKYRPHLAAEKHLTFRVPFNRTRVRQLSAQKTLIQNPEQAKQAIILREKGPSWHFLNSQLIGRNNIWIGQRDLLESGPFAREFVVETEESGQTYLRFGEGKNGKRPNPGHSFDATYRVGNGTEGNTGPETITTIVSDNPLILGVRNPKAAEGGVNPESNEEIRLNAPVAFHSQQRCVTEADYAARVEQYPDVLQARAYGKWTGSWNTIFIQVLRHSGKKVDKKFAEQIKTFLSPWAMVGTDLAVVGAKFVPVSIELKVMIASHAIPNQVLQRLHLAFSQVRFPDGNQGFFAPERFSLGKPLVLSKIIERALEVNDVVRVEATRFQRLDKPTGKELEVGEIRVSPLEVIQVLNNHVGVREKGSIEFNIYR